MPLAKIHVLEGNGPVSRRRAAPCRRISAIPCRRPAIGLAYPRHLMFLEGRVSYEETSGTKGIIEPGGVEWMRAAGGVWHTAGAVGTARIKGYQLWIALTPEMESIESEAHYL